MNFDNAIKAHTAWKMTLSSYLRKPDGSLKAAEVQADSRCPLGQWLHGEGKSFAKHPEYQILVAEHARFHKAAAEVIKKADSGKLTNEDTALGGKSEFSAASTKVVSAIMAMKAKA